MDADWLFSDALCHVLAGLSLAVYAKTIPANFRVELTNFFTHACRPHSQHQVYGTCVLEMPKITRFVRRQKRYKLEHFHSSENDLSYEEFQNIILL